MAGDFEHGADAFIEFGVMDFEPAGDADEVERLAQRQPPPHDGHGGYGGEPDQRAQPADDRRQGRKPQIKGDQHQQSGECGDDADQGAAGGEHAADALAQAAQHRFETRSDRRAGVHGGRRIEGRELRG